MSKKLLVIAAHPDDEVLGCGATMSKHIRGGDEVHVVILAEGITSRDDQRSRDRRGQELSALAKAAHQANEILGVSSLTMHDFPDNRMDTVDRLEVVKVVEGLIGWYQPDIVYTHHAGDLNIDHRCVHQAVVTACRPVPAQPVRRLLFFEVASSTGWQPPGSAPCFSPTWFEDVTETLSIKLSALAAYDSEMRPWPHARSIKALEYLARWRGASIGVEAAEAFVLGRNIE